MNLERERQKAADEEDKFQKSLQFGLDVSRHIQDSKTKEVWRQQQLGRDEGKAAGELGMESPSGQYVDPSAQEYADVGHLEGQVGRQQSQDKLGRDAFARKQLDLEFRYNDSERRRQEAEAKLAEQQRWHDMLLPTIQQRANAATTNARANTTRANTGVTKANDPAKVLESIWQQAGKDASNKARDLMATPEDKKAAADAHAEIAGILAAVRLGQMDGAAGVQAIIAKYPQYATLLAGGAAPSTPPPPTIYPETGDPLQQAIERQKAARGLK